MKRLILLFVISLPTLGLLGCSEKSSELKVTGSVTINGEPIDNGTISFVADDGVAATGGGVIKDGTYTAFVTPGAKTVMVTGNRKIGEEPEYQGVDDSPMRPIYQTVTPAAYNAAHLSTLKADISEAQDGLDFQLTGDPPKPEKLK